jgi:hypothetical protein
MSGARQPHRPADSSPFRHRRSLESWIPSGTALDDHMAFLEAEGTYRFQSPRPHPTTSPIRGLRRAAEWDRSFGDLRQPPKKRKEKYKSVGAASHSSKALNTHVSTCTCRTKSQVRASVVFPFHSAAPCLQRLRREPHFKRRRKHVFLAF